MIVTDLGSSVRASVPPWTLAETGLGTTVLGASKLFTLSTLGAVSVSPAAALGVRTARVASTATDRSGSRLVTASPSLPAAPWRR